MEEINPKRKLMQWACWLTLADNAQMEAKLAREGLRKGQVVAALLRVWLDGTLAVDRLGNVTVTHAERVA